MDISCSSLLLIEDSADSEGDHTDFFTLYPFSSTATNIFGHKEEDAESCTCDCECDIANLCSLVKEDEDGQRSDELVGDGDDNYCLDCSMWLSDEASEEMECSFSSNFLIDDDDDEESRMVEVDVNDVDDKLFWEICMAVGYP